MLRISSLFALIALLFASASAETIVSDSLGNQIGLPFGGGNATGSITNTNAAISTSPYTLSVFVNDGQSVGSNTGEVESFYFTDLQANGLFGNASLFSSKYSSNFNSLTAVGNPANPRALLGNVSNPNTAPGLYIYVFNIPTLGSVFVNMTYINQVGTYPNPLPVVDLISILVTNPATVVGDPQFVGLRGQSYQIHGIDGAVYNIISEASTQVNAKFVFLTEGECPIVNGVSEKNCWSHPGSYLGEMSFQQKVAGKTHQALIKAGDAKVGFASIQLDGKTLKVGDSLSYGTFSITVNSAFSVSITTESFTFELSNSDMFVNQAVSSRVPLSKLTSHGLLGQTHSTKVFSTATRYIEGEVDDYVIADNNIFGSDFSYNKF